jgi:hypothetical protein
MFRKPWQAGLGAALLALSLGFLASGCRSNDGGGQVATTNPQAAPAEPEPTEATPPTETDPTDTTETDPTDTTETAATKETSAVTGGHVPAELIGAWTGGPGSRSGFRYEFHADGTYRFTGILQQEGGPTYVLQESGTVDVHGSRMRLEPQDAQFRREPPSSPGGSWRQVDRSPRTVSWSLISTAGVEVLRIIDEASGGESSFVRDTP